MIMRMSPLLLTLWFVGPDPRMNFMETYTIGFLHRNQFYEAGFCQRSHFILLLYKNGHTGQVNEWMIKDTTKVAKHCHILTVLFLTS